MQHPLTGVSVADGSSTDGVDLEMEVVVASFYAYISPTELVSQHDPVRLLRSATTLEELLAHPSYNPDELGGFWARSKVDPPQQNVQIQNERTGLSEPASVCGLEH
jgi:hypothetical protein